MSERGSTADLEEPLRDLVHLCEGLRALCARGEAQGLSLSDAEPLALLAAQLAADLHRRWLDRLRRGECRP